jgi:hypothetical protein
LADAILRREHRLALLHRQTFGLVGEVRAGRVQDRIVVAAPQLECDLTGDGARDPALRGPQHHRLRIEPAPLIEEPAEPATVVAVLFDRVLVVDAGYQALVGNVQQGHSGRFIDAAALGLDDPVLDLIAHAEAMASADTVRLEHQFDGVGVGRAVE